LVTCPNCGQRNSAENAHCVNCGARLPTAPVRGSGVAYRRTEQTEPPGGGGQGLLAFGAVLLAGLLFAVGAIALLMSPRAEATRTPISGALGPTSSLAIFEQETPSPQPRVTALPSFMLFTPTPSLPFPSPLIPPSVTPTGTPASTRQPTPTPAVNCAAANGSNIQTRILGYGNAQSTGSIERAWCIHAVIFRPFVDAEFEGPNTGEPGVTRLFEDGRRIASDTCSADECNDKTERFSPPHLTPAGSTLRYEFTCIDNPGTADVDECTDEYRGGSTIEIQYEPIRGT
jgi:hypothetical protein